MDEITVYGGTFEECLINLEAVLHRCIEKDLVLNWDKCHFMVHQGIVLGHIISEKGIEIDVEDQEKTTFTCPFGTYAYRRMSFGLCNAPGTFQRCMLSIFSDMVERIMKVFMDDITVYGGTFEECLVNL